MKQRLDYIDAAKGIGILLVVWAHILIVGPSHKLIYAFHMPLFFFVSALLFKPEKYASVVELVRKRARRLLLPYFLYSVATWCVWAGFRYLRGDEVDSYVMPLLQTFIAQGSGAFMMHNSALWFIPCLFVLEIIFYFLCKLGTRNMIIASIAIAGLGCLLAHQFGNDYLLNMPWNLDAAIFALPFYAVAYVLREKVGPAQLQECVRERVGMSFFAAILMVGAMSLLAFCYGENSMGSSSYMCPMYVFYLRSFLGSFAMVILTILICKMTPTGIFVKTMKWCGINSLDILCLHIPVKGVTAIVVAKMLHPMVDESEDALSSAVAFMITMAVLVPIIHCINKYIRKIES